MNERPSAKLIYPQWCVFNSQNNPNGCILALPGRGGTGTNMAMLYRYANLHKVMIVGVTPEKFEWYPQPYGAFDQEDAVLGLDKAIISVDRILWKIENKFGIPKERTAIVGFSAGGVMAIQAGINLPYNFAGIVCHGGAILEPNKVPSCNKDTPILLIHATDDEAFGWDERYLPMKDSLITNGYKVKTHERIFGGHRVLYRDISVAGSFLAQRFGVEEKI